MWPSGPVALRRRRSGPNLMTRRAFSSRSICALLLGGLLAAALLPAGARPAAAQAGAGRAGAGRAGAGRAEITAVDASTFPTVNAFVLVADEAGGHVAGLSPSAFELIENNARVAELQAAETDVGVQVVFVLDTSDPFSVRDVRGVTRLEYIQQAMADYAENTPWMKGGLDDVTILAAEGPVIEHSNNPTLVAQAMAGYSSDFAGVADQYPLLNRSLGYATDASRRPGMQHFMVLISNGFNRSDAEGVLADLSTRATAAQIPIYTIYVGPTGSEATVGAVNLQRLSEMTGGQRLIFQGPETFTPLFQMLSDHGRQYLLSYRSQLASTGQHTLAARVTPPGSAELSTNEAIFPLRIAAPTVSLESLPESLVRVAPTHDADPATADPSAYAVGLTIDFPDGHPRGLRQAELLVDGTVVDSVESVYSVESGAESLTSLTWPLAAYVENKEHSLQVRVMDELGLVAESDVQTVSVSMQVPAAPAGPPPGIASLPGWPLLSLAGLGLGLALVVGLGAWWLVARRNGAEEDLEDEAPPTRAIRRPANVETTMPMRPAAPPGGARDAPPAALPAAGGPRRSVGLPAFRWPGRATRPVPRNLASLEVVEPGGSGAPRVDIELLSDTITLGRDAAVAEAIFDDRSVSRLHARIKAEDGTFRVYDAGSTSGTWVNYAPVPAETGCALQHGDLINLGRVQLRFKLRNGAAPGAGAPAVRVVKAAAGTSRPAPPSDEEAL